MPKSLISTITRKRLIKRPKILFLFQKEMRAWHFECSVQLFLNEKTENQGPAKESLVQFSYFLNNFNNRN